MPTPALLSPTAQQAAEKTFEQFCRQFPAVTIEAGSTIIEAGRSSSVLYYIDDGCVKMSSTSSLGDTVTLHLYYPGNCFPFLHFVTQTNSYDFSAMTKVIAHKVPLEKLTDFLRQQPEVSLLLNLKFLKGMQSLLHRIEQSVFVAAYYQVAGILYYFARHFMQMDGKVITIKLTHKDISEWLGLSRENVSLQMKQLERDGVIARRGQLIEIANLEELQRLATPQDLLL